jgi:large subunit ribosomal protein L3
MKFILGQKIEMTQLFDEVGNMVPATIVKAGPCVVTQVKSKDQDGYESVQIGFGEKKSNSKALKGHFGALGNFRFAREFRDKIQNPNNKIIKLEVGNQITAETFNVGDEVKVTGTSKGKGFQGVVRRHHFHGHPATHGHKDQERMPGSIGAGGVQHVVKGRRMAGHMGNEQVSVKNVEIVKIDLENNLLYIKGAVPGARSGLIEIIGEGELKITKKQDKQEKSVEQEISNQKPEVGNRETAPTVEEKTETPTVEEKVEAPAEVTSNE